MTDIDYSTFTDEQLGGLASTAWAELERRRRDHDVITIAARAYDDSIGYDSRDVALSVLSGIHGAGWRIVRTDPNTEPDERPIVIEEWTP